MKRRRRPETIERDVGQMVLVFSPSQSEREGKMGGGRRGKEGGGGIAIRVLSPPPLPELYCVVATV